MFFSLFKRPHIEFAVALFDVGSGSIGASVAIFKPGSLPVLHTRPRVELALQKNLSYERFRSLMLRGFEKSAHDLLTNLPPEALSLRRDLHFSVVLASPWYLSKTKFVRFEKEKEFTVTPELMIKLVEHTIERFEEEMQEEEGMEEARLCERLILNTSLNGYSTPEPQGKRTSRLDLTLHLSVISEDIETRIKEVIHRQFHANNVSFHTYPLASYVAVRDIFPKVQEYLIADVGSEITDIFLIRSDILVETVSFPLGKNHFLRFLSKSLHLEVETAISMVRGAREGMVGTERERKALERAALLWSAEAENALASLSKEKLLPTLVYLSADEDVKGWFSSLIKDARFVPLTITRTSFEVILLDAETLGHHVSYQGSFDPFLTLEALALKKQFTP